MNKVLISKEFYLEFALTYTTIELRLFVGQNDVNYWFDYLVDYDYQ